MIVINRLINWYGKRAVYGALGVIVALIAIGGTFLILGGGSPEAEKADSVKRVTIAQAGLLATESSALRTVGQVRAISEARLETESSGRVTSVTVAIGDRVSAGTVLASIENSSERASLLQAEGAYDAATVLNTQASIDLDESEVAAENTYRTSLTIAEDAIRNLADELFEDPGSRNPGLRISGQGNATQIGIERSALEVVLEAWSANVASGMRGDKGELLDQAERDLTRINAFISDLSILVAEEDTNEIFTATVLASYKTRFLSARSGLDGALSSVSRARNTLENDEQSAGSASVGTASDARIKQALGSLRSAQSAYEKTLVRSPISGVVNAMYLRANEYVSAGQPAAIIANNGALEITTSVSEEERDQIAIGQSVTINDSFKGAITRIAPAIDPTTGKIEVKISVNADAKEGLENGTTVSLSLLGEVTKGDGPLRVPLRALKITPQGPVAFVVSAEGTLEARPITIGTIVGDAVIVEAGIDSSTVIVSDARGLKEGERVEVTQN